MDEIQLPQIKNLHEITQEQMEAYIRFVATLRHNQNRYFRLKNLEALEISRNMERALDALNAELLDPQPKLF